MKKYLLIVLTVLITIQSKSQSAKQIFESPSLPVLLASAKKVAILPYKVSISYKKMPKGLTLEQIKDNESAESIQMQQGMYTYLLKKSKDYSENHKPQDFSKGKSK